MVGRCLLAACLGTAVLAPAASWAQGPDNMGPLRDVLLIGELEDGTWAGAVEGEDYVLRNAADPSAIHYAYVDGGPLPERLNVAVNVRVDGTEGDDGLIRGAGLIYAFRPQPLSYLAVVLSEDGTLRLLEREPAGLREIDAITLANFDADAFHELRLIEYIDGITAIVDDTDAIDLYTDAVGTGTIGIVAFGTGSFAYRDFAVTEVRGVYVSAQQVGYGRDTQQ
jgi:hypothetical protein